MMQDSILFGVDKTLYFVFRIRNLKSLESSMKIFFFLAGGSASLGALLTLRGELREKISHLVLNGKKYFFCKNC